MSEKMEMLTKVINLSNRFTEIEGRRPRMLIASTDGNSGFEIHEFSSSFSDMGFDIDIVSNRNSKKQIVQQAIDNDAHGILLVTNDEKIELLAVDLKKLLEDHSCQDMIILLKVNPISTPNNMPISSNIKVIKMDTSPMIIAQIFFDLYLVK